MLKIKKIAVAIFVITLFAIGGLFYIYRDVQKSKLARIEQKQENSAPEEAKIDISGVESVEDLESTESLSYWINLGLQKKAQEDYEGARDAWEYASKIRPKNALSFHNLGMLYGYFLEDNAKAEQNFEQAIQNNPQEAFLYIGLFEFYRDVVKDKEKARAVLERGIQAQTGYDDVLRARLEGL